MNLQNLVDNINNSQHRITEFTPNIIQEAVLENDLELLKKAQENEL
jgi:hypothetical protein